MICWFCISLVEPWIQVLDFISFKHLSYATLYCTWANMLHQEVFCDVFVPCCHLTSDGLYVMSMHVLSYAFFYLVNLFIIFKILKITTAAFQAWEGFFKSSEVENLWDTWYGERCPQDWIYQTSVLQPKCFWYGTTTSYELSLGYIYTSTRYNNMAW